MILQVRPLRFLFRAVDPVWFPPGKAANIFRGAFGQIFREIACDPACRDARSCPRAPHCAYARMFEPRGNGRGWGDGSSPSGFEDQPRPFVLRAASLNGRRFVPGERFTLDVNVFDPDMPALEYFRQTFMRLCEEGLGPGRPRVELSDALELPVVQNDLTAGPEPVKKIRVTLLTPTELKIDGEILRQPRFDALIKRARDRVGGLIVLYQKGSSEGLSEFDFRGMGERARAVRMTAGHFEESEYERRSGRTGQRHGLGGFTGEAEYEGDLAEFLPYLKAAWWTGVGRLTVWGNGMLKVEESRPAGGQARAWPELRAGDM